MSGTFMERPATSTSSHVTNVTQGQQTSQCAGHIFEQWLISQMRQMQSAYLAVQSRDLSCTLHTWLTTAKFGESVHHNTVLQAHKLSPETLQHTILELIISTNHSQLEAHQQQQEHPAQELHI